MTDERFDAVVVGAGPNGLAAAVTMAARGLSVRLYEAADTVGGGCRTAPLTLPGFVHDVCSTAHPLAAGTSFLRSLDLPSRGVVLRHAELPFAHPLNGGRAGVAHRCVDETAAGLGSDAAAYRKLMAPLVERSEDIVSEIFEGGFRRIPRHPLPLARFGLPAIASARSLADRLFSTEEARGLFAGVAAHAFLPLDRRPTAAFGLILTMLAHSVGWPVVEGGSQVLSDAMAQLLLDLGGEIVVGHEVTSLAELPKARATLLDVSPAQLLRLAGEALPWSYRRSLNRYRFGPGVFKVDFALSGPVPWANANCLRAGTLHLGGTFDEIAASEADAVAGRHNDNPYVLAVQATVADPTRAPAGQHTLWTYCHVPHGSSIDMTSAIEAQVERFAPGFRDLVLARTTRNAVEYEAYDANFIGGDINGGSQTIWQTGFRPTPRWNPYTTALSGVYLCSASTPPGGGVHGMCGFNAAQVALQQQFGMRRGPLELAGSSAR
jgi:phytoene dehydrogenase-like protein